MWDATVEMPVIHVIVPSVSAPVSCSIRGASAATSTEGGSVDGMSSGPTVMALSISPSTMAASPRSIGSSASRYSDMYLAGRS